MRNVFFLPRLDDELREGTHDSPDSRLKLKAEENDNGDEDDDDDDDDWTEDSDDYEDDDDEIGEARRPTSIRFSHTKSEGPKVGIKRGVQILVEFNDGYVYIRKVSLENLEVMFIT